jgi:hypothetical protein
MTQSLTHSFNHSLTPTYQVLAAPWPPRPWPPGCAPPCRPIYGQDRQIGRPESEGVFLATAEVAGGSLRDDEELPLDDGCTKAGAHTRDSPEGSSLLEDVRHIGIAEDVESLRGHYKHEEQRCQKSFSTPCNNSAHISGQVGGRGKCYIMISIQCAATSVALKRRHADPCIRPTHNINRTDPLGPHRTETHLGGAVPRTREPRPSCPP